MKPSAETVKTAVVVSFSDPEMPVMVRLYCPGTALVLAVRVSVLDSVVGLGEKDAVTPLGSPETESVTLPAKPFCELMFTYAVPEPPGTTLGLSYSERVKLGAATVAVKVLLALIVPDVPVTVTLYCPTAAVLLAVNVSTLDPAVGLGLHDAVTPLGRPETERFTLPVKPYSE